LDVLARSREIAVGGRITRPAAGRALQLRNDAAARVRSSSNGDHTGELMRIAGKVGTVAGAGLLSLALVAGPAGAHECFNVNRAAQADAVIAQHSHGWFDIQTSQLLAIFVTSCVQQPAEGCPPTPPTLTSADITYLQSTSFDQLLGEIFGFAPRSTAVTDVMTFTDQVAAIAAGCGVPTHYLTLNNASAAGGAPSKITTDGKGIDHFPDVYSAQLFAAFVQALGGPAAC
jgi:hypothetical protein